MITRTFLDKCTTIIRDTTNNYGLHPILMLNYGNLLSRIVLHFDISKIQEKIEDKTYIDTSKLTHVLKMKNCASVNPEKYKQKLVSSDINGIKERATSFTLIAFALPKPFDEGIGFDNANDFWLIGKSAISKDGCTWYNSTNEELWDEEGIYLTETLDTEYENYKNGKGSIIIAVQHFDHGNENIELDLTNYINKTLIEEKQENNGICIAFAPDLEETNTEYTQYVGFFNNKTNTIFEPVIESRYDCDINDDRYAFTINKTNKLYLYSFIGGELTNLDELPTCELSDCGEIIDDLEVVQESKGIYSTELKLSSRDGYHKDMLLTDLWSNIIYDGETFEAIEQEFATLPSELHFSIGKEVREPHKLNPIIAGINDNEKINRGETRIMKVFFKVPYEKDEYKLVNKAWYRIYTMDGEREISIVDWDKLLKMERHNYFAINTDEYVPTKYFIDIKAKFGDEERIFKKVLTYEIISVTTEQTL